MLIFEESSCKDRGGRMRQVSRDQYKETRLGAGE